MASSVLHRTLGDLCHEAWCYAVFWKLKRQPRMVLTWEDAFYEQSKNQKMLGSHLNPSPMNVMVSQGELSNVEDPIGLSVAKMSYHIYSVGEGIIGKVAFTNKHQWVFNPSNKVVVTTGSPNNKRRMQSQPDKYPAGWDHQFAAGINTIAVIAVPQGVVQLGSTQTISEDMKLVAHVKSLFGTLHSIPGVYPSDLVTEVQNGGIHTVYSMHHANTSRIGVTGNALIRTPPRAASGHHPCTGIEAFGGTISHSSVGGIPVLFNRHSQPQTQPLPLVIGVPGGAIQGLHPMPYKPGGWDSGNQTPTMIDKVTNVDLDRQKPTPIGRNHVELAGQTSAPIVKIPNVELCRQTSNPNIWAHRVGMGSMKATASPRLGIISKISLSSGYSTTTTDHIEAKNMNSLPSVTSAKYSSMKMPDASVSDKIEVSAALGVSSCGLLNSPTLECKALSPLQTSPSVLSTVKPPSGSWSTVKDYQVVGLRKSLADSKVVSSVGHPQYIAARPRAKVPQSLRDTSPKKVQEPILYSPSVDKPAVDFINSRYSKNSLDQKMLRDCHSILLPDSEQHLVDVAQNVIGNEQNRFLSKSVYLDQTSFNSKDGTSILMEKPQLSDHVASSETKQLFSGPPSSRGMQLFARHNGRLTSDIGYQSLEDRKRPRSPEITAERYQNVKNRHLICESQSSVGQKPRDVHLSEPSHQFVHTENRKVSQLVTMRSLEVNSLPIDTTDSTLFNSGAAVNSDSTSYNSVESGVFTHAYNGLQPLDASNSSICSNSQTSHRLQLSEISDRGLTDSSTVTTGLDDTLFCEGFMKDWNSSKMPFHDVDFNVNQYFDGDDGTDNTFKIELEDFDNFLASLTNENENKNGFISELEAGAACTSPNKETMACKVGCNIQESMYADWSTKVQTTREGFNQFQQAVIPVPPLSNQRKTKSWLKKRVFSGDDIRIQQEERQKIRRCLLELQNIIPSGGNYTIGTLLDKIVKYADFLQTVLHDSVNQIQCNKRQKGNDRIGVPQQGVEGKEINASWVMELNQKGNRCPIIVEDLTQPQHMLVEVVCEQTGMIKEIEKSFKKLHVVVLKSIMEARDGKIWARFVVKAPQDAHRIQVLWSLMQLLEPK